MQNICSNVQSGFLDPKKVLDTNNKFPAIFFIEEENTSEQGDSRMFSFKMKLVCVVKDDLKYLDSLRDQFEDKVFNELRKINKDGLQHDIVDCDSSNLPSDHPFMAGIYSNYASFVVSLKLPFIRSDLN